MALYFTADLHLGHGNIIRHCERPFASVEEMDAAIIAEINAKVTESDTLYILGDFVCRGRSHRHYRSLVRCQDVRLLLGNHDHRTRSKAAGFQSIKDVDEITVDGHRIWMSHYAHRSWPASHRGSWHLYGHSHGMLDGADVQGMANALDVGVDNCCGYGLRFGEPWSVADIANVLPRQVLSQKKRVVKDTIGRQVISDMLQFVPRSQRALVLYGPQALVPQNNRRHPRSSGSYGDGP